MAKKSLVLLLGFLMICSGVQMEMFQRFDRLDPVREMKFSYHDIKTVENELLPVCGTCKYVVRKVKTLLGKTLTKDEVSRQLDTVCVKIKIPGCKTLVQKYRIKLINALISGDNVQAICNSLKLCK